MFHNYTYEGCIFECRLKKAFKAIGCLPWDYPIPPQLEEEEALSMTQVLTSNISIEHVYAMFPPEVDTALIPTGRLVCVKGTPFDLTKPTRLGEVLFPDPSLCSISIAMIHIRCWTPVLAGNMPASVTLMSSMKMWLRWRGVGCWKR